MYTRKVNENAGNKCKLFIMCIRRENYTLPSKKALIGKTILLITARLCHDYIHYAFTNRQSTRQKPPLRRLLLRVVAIERSMAAKALTCAQTFH